MLSRMGGVSDELYISLRNRLREKNLLPEEPPGTSFWRYVGQLEKPLRAGDKEAPGFCQEMEGVVGAVLTGGRGGSSWGAASEGSQVVTELNCLSQARK